MRQPFRLGVLLSASLACLAQSPSVTLYRGAKVALSAVPAPARAAQLLAIAEAEQKYHPQMARTDLQQAFAGAVALPPGLWQRYVKRYVELSVITRLDAQPGGFVLAHALARKADIRCAWTYSELIAAAAVRTWMLAHPHGMPQTNLLTVDFIISPGFVPPVLPPRTPPMAAPDNIAALAQECTQTDGSFPYRGALTALRFYRLSASERDTLLREGYTAAAGETDSQAFPDAVSFLRAGHTSAPSLDAELEVAAGQLLPHLQTAMRTAQAARGDQRTLQMATERALMLELSGSRLLQLLDSFDATTAADLRARYPGFPPHMRTRGTFSSHPQPGALDPATALAPAEAMPEVTQQERQKKFLALLNLAMRHRPQDPSVARAAAVTLQLMNPTLFELALPLMAQLALLLKQERNQPQQAEALIHRCLDALESEAVLREHRFDTAPARFQPGLALLFETSGWRMSVFAIAAQIDPALAEQRAAQTQAAYFKPLFLAQVAAGLEGQIP